MGKRLLNVGVLPESDCIGGNYCVSVVRCSYEHTVNLLADLIEHNSPIFEELGLGIIIECLLCISPVNIAQCDDVLCTHVFQIAAAYASDADTGDVHLVTGSYVAVTLAQN